MTTSSADVTALHRYSTGLATRAEDLAAAVAAATRALTAYAAACPAVPVDQRLGATASGRVQQVRSLAVDVRLIMEAFANADRGSGPPTLGPATMSDLQLSRHLARAAPGLAVGDLLAPIRARTAQGEEAGAALAALADALKEGREGSVHRSAGVLETLAPEDLEDPAFAAGFLDQLDAETIELLTAGILRHRHGSPHDLPPALVSLQALLHSAGLTWSGHFQGDPLRPDLLTDLVATPVGRQTLRFLLVGGDSAPAPPELIRRLQHQLLVDSSATLDSRHPADEVSRFLDLHDVDIDSILLRRISADTGLVNDLLADPSTVSRIRHNLGPSSYPALAVVTAVRLDHLTGEAGRRLADHARGLPSTGSASATQRADDTVRAHVSAIAADPGGAATEELVLVAESVRFHMGYYLDPGPETRSAGAGPRAEIDALIPAFAEDRAALVVLLAEVEHWEREVLDRHFTDGDPHLTTAQIAHIDHFQSRLHTAAVQADVPDDDWAFAVGVARGLVDHGASAAAVKSKGASLLAAPAAHRGLDRIHEALKGEPGDHAGLGEAQQARRRINAWCALARSDLGSALRWGDLGEVEVRDLADLAALDPDDPADHQRLARWSLLQDDDLRRRVEEVVGT